MPRTSSLSSLLAVFTLAFSCLTLVAQQQPVTGVQPFGSIDQRVLESINLGNLNYHFAIPVIHKAGRGLPFNFDLTYDSLFWVPVTSGSTTTWTPKLNWGWQTQLNSMASLTGYIPSPKVTYSSCRYFNPDLGRYITESYEVDKYAGFVDSMGTYHAAPATYYYYSSAPDCTSGQDLATVGKSQDGSGYTLHIDTSTVNTREGAVIQLGTGANWTEDRNGNEITLSQGGGTTTFTDTTNSTALTITGVAPSQQTYQYTGPTGAASVKVNYYSPTVCTNFHVTGISEYAATTVPLVSSITMPDGSSYQFTYEPVQTTPTPPSNCTGAVTGRIASITIPSGGTITYTYSGGPSNSGIFADGTTAGISRVETPGDGQPSGTWTYTRAEGSPYTTNVTDPQNNMTSLTFQAEANGLGYYFETSRQVTDHALGALESVQTCYNGSAIPCTGTAVTMPISQLTQISQVPNSSGYQTETYTLFDTYGNVTEVEEFDWASGAPGGLLRKTLTSYANLVGISNFPSQVTVQDGSGHTTSQTNYSYDQTTPASTSVLQHIAPAGARGNLTTVIAYASSGSALTTTYSYWDTGNVNQLTDPSSAKTTYTYSACQGAFPTLIAVTGVTELDTNNTWDCNGGVITQTTDPNNQASNYKYANGSSNDTVWSLKETDFPDHGVHSSTLTTSSQPWTVVTSQKVDSTQTSTAQSELDGFGRVYKTQNNSLTPSTEVDTTYDALGRVQSVTNPYIATSDPTYGATSFAYDALGRPTGTTNPDGTSNSIIYGAGAVTSADEGRDFNGDRIQRTVQYDGIGRIKSVCEITAGIYWYGSLYDQGTSCSTNLGGTGFTTSYLYDYDAANSAARTTVSQGSLNSRVYEYDWLGRLTSEANPESYGNATTYLYNSVGDLYQRTRPKQNQPDPNTKVTTTYSYDAYHRLRQISYNDGATPTVYYNYDESTAWTMTIPNGKGRLTTEYVGGVPGFAGSLYFYDSIGRVTNRQQCTPSVCGVSSWSNNYGYNFAGDLTSETDLPGYTYSYAYDPAQHLTGVTSSINNPGTLASNLLYNPFGELASGSYGNGVSLSRTYDNMGRLTSLSDTKSSTTVHSITGPGSGNKITYFPDSNISEATDSVNGAWRYGYDDLNRLILASGPGAVTNLALDSEQFDQSTWVRNNATVTPNTVQNPNGTGVTADTITGNASDSYISQFLQMDAGTTYTFAVSLRVPSGTGTVYILEVDSAQAVQSTLCSLTTSWSRCSVTFTATTSGVGHLQIGGGSTIGSGVSIYVWGAQCEPSTSAATGTYVATTSAATVTNLALYSEQFDQSVWGRTNATITPNTVQNPNNTGATADTITGNASDSYIYQYGIQMYAGATYTFTVWLRVPSGTRSVYILEVDSAQAVQSTLCSLTTSWSRCSVTFIATTTGSGHIQIGGGSTIGSGVSLYAWGAQCEPSSPGGTYVATTTSPENGGTNSYTYDYDRYGNRTHENLAGTANPSYSFDTNNHLNGGAGVFYDAMGNITNDGTHTYQYDAEERLLSVDGGSTASYQYDAEGNRVKTTVNGTSLEFLYGIDHHRVSTILSSNRSWYGDEIYAGNWHLGTYTGSTTNFIHSDWLGTVRVRTDSTGAVVENYTSLPFGDALSSVGINVAHFTDQDRDTETGLDHFLFRQYSSVQGRWMTPDPAGLGAVDPSNPQTWNRYAYGMNSPINNIDDMGLSVIDCSWDPCGFASSGGGYYGGLGTGVYVGGVQQTTFTTSGLGANAIGGQVPPGCSGGACVINGNLYQQKPSGQFGWCGGGGLSYYCNEFAPAPSSVRASLPTIGGIDLEWWSSFGRSFVSDFKIPKVCNGGAFLYGGGGLELGPAEGELIGVVSWDSASGGQHGGILAGGFGPFVGGGEWTRTWSDWQTHFEPIYFGSGTAHIAPKQFGPMKVTNVDAGGLFQYSNGNVTVGGYTGGSNHGSGRAAGGGGYVVLSLTGCKG